MLLRYRVSKFIQSWTLYWFKILSLLIKIKMSSLKKKILNKTKFWWCPQTSHAVLSLFLYIILYINNFIHYTLTQWVLWEQITYGTNNLGEHYLCRRTFVLWMFSRYWIISPVYFQTKSFAVISNECVFETSQPRELALHGVGAKFCGLLVLVIWLDWMY